MGLRAGLDWCGKSRPTGTFLVIFHIICKLFVNIRERERGGRDVTLSILGPGASRRWGSAPSTGRFTPGNASRYSLYMGLGGTLGRVRKTSPTPRF